MDVILLFDMSQVYGILFVDLNMERKVIFLSIIPKTKMIMSILTTIQLFVENNTSLFGTLNQSGLNQFGSFISQQFFILSLLTQRIGAC